ncbi:MAG: V-type ATPase subunit [Clostridia bacterium]|nr:V-type ATPase subunit [Clostridia bacterium]
MARTPDSAYIYASTKVNSADGVGTETSRLARLLECTSVRDVYEAVADSGICHVTQRLGAVSDSDTVNEVTKLLEGALDSAVSLMREAVPESRLYDFLLYKFDCNNIKSAIKSALRGVSAEGTLFSCGSVDTAVVADCVKNRIFSPLPAHMGRAAAEAIDTFERTGEARSIDFIIDRACFADMADSAGETEIPMFTEYVKALADVTNIRTAVRIARSALAASAAEALMERVFVPGGNVPMSAFSAEGGGICNIEAIAANLPLIPLKAEISGALDTSTSLDAILDRYVERTVKNFTSKAFGPEIPAGFFITREREIRRYRKALSLISMGSIKKETLKERLGIL